MIIFRALSSSCLMKYVLLLLLLLFMFVFFASGNGSQADGRPYTWLYVMDRNS